MADDGKRPLTRWDAKVAWLTAGVAAIVVGAYVRLDVKVSEVDRRTVAVQTRQEAQDGVLRGIERSVYRIEGRLGIDVPAPTAAPNGGR